VTVRALVVSDTHLREGRELPVALFPLLRVADVVVHAGDITAAGVLAAGTLFAALGSDYARVGSLCSLVYALGLVAIWLTADQPAVAPLPVADGADRRPGGRDVG